MLDVIEEWFKHRFPECEVDHSTPNWAEQWMQFRSNGSAIRVRVLNEERHVYGFEFGLHGDELIDHSVYPSFVVGNLSDPAFDLEQALEKYAIWVLQESGIPSWRSPGTHGMPYPTS